MILGKSVTQYAKPVLRRIHHLEQVEIFWRNRAGIGHHFQIQSFAPIFAAINDDQNFLRELLRLRQSQDFKQLIQSPKTTGENHQSLGEIRKPELTHEKVMKLKI